MGLVRISSGSIWFSPDGTCVKVVETFPSKITCHERHGSVGKFSTSYTRTFDRSTFLKTFQLHKEDGPGRSAPKPKTKAKKAKATKRKATKAKVATA